MIVPISTFTAFYAFSQSDWFGRFIVVILCFISVYAWTVMFDKYKEFRNVKRLNILFKKDFFSSSSILETYISSNNSGPLNRIYSTAIEKLFEILEVNKAMIETTCKSGRISRNLTTIEMDILINSMQHSVSIEILKLEKHLDSLATAVSVSPFFGLLGTVWGVMVAFCGMAEKNSADINTLAPGVSGALLTTVVGLLVAIPSLIGYNILTNQLRKLIVDIDDFVNDFEGLLKSQTMK